jgi:hypothetical protein
MNWLIRLGDALSQFLNVLLFNGDSNHSISGDAWRFKRERTRKVIDFVFAPLEKDHCYKAHLHDVRKATRLAQEWNNDLRAQ